MDLTQSRLHTVQGCEEGAGDMADSDRIVIFRSPLTDLGPLPATLQRHDMPFREVVFSMKSAADRDRFRDLRHGTGQRTLPQVFVDGRFVGGINEACRAVEALAGGDPVRRARSQRLMAMARWLGYGGLLPFVAGAVGIWWTPFAVPVALGMVTYAAVILAFVGAVHWGVTVARDPRRSGAESLIVSVLPALYGWLVAWLSPAGVALWLMAAGFAGLRLYEMARRDHNLPAWYRDLRNHLTLGAFAALIVGALA